MSKTVNNREYALGYFLQCNADSESKNWEVSALAELRLLHISDPTKSVVKIIQHLFKPEEHDWGFSAFIPMVDIMKPENGFYNQLKDCITLEVWLNSEKPSGVI